MVLTYFCACIRPSREQTLLGSFARADFLITFFENLGYKLEEGVPIEIEQDEAEALKTACEIIIKNPFKGTELLPSNHYDEQYMENIKKIRDCLEFKILPAFNTADFISFDYDL